MSAIIIVLPTVRIEASARAQVQLPALCLPERVYARLQKIAGGWGVSPNAAAEMLLLQAINDAAGIRKRSK